MLQSDKVTSKIAGHATTVPARVQGKQRLTVAGAVLLAAYVAPAIFTCAPGVAHPAATLHTLSFHRSVSFNHLAHHSGFKLATIEHTGSQDNLRRPPVLPGKNSTFIGRCVAIIDGDAIVVEHMGQRYKVDLWGVDCPEPGQPYNLQARQFTTTKVLNQLVRVHVKGRPRHGHLPGWVDIAGGGTLNETLVASGYAWYYRKQAHDAFLLPILEDSARQDHRGLWAGKDPISPSSWRRRHGL